MKPSSVEGCHRLLRAKGMCATHWARSHNRGTLELTVMRGFSVVERVRAKIKYAPTGCWLFTGCHQGGYGYISEDGRMRGAHIVMYEERHGPVPDGLELDHLCRVTSCCNPDHLEAVTHMENVRRGRLAEVQRVRVTALNRVRHLNKVTCINGHPYVPENIGSHHGYRYCRTCSRIRSAQRREAKRAQAA